MLIQMNYQRPFYLIARVLAKCLFSVDKAPYIFFLIVFLQNRMLSPQEDGNAFFPS